MNRLTALPVTLLATLAMTVALLVTAPTVPAEAATPAQKYARAAQKATNVARTDHDRAKVKGDACLRRHARSHARRMAKEQRIWHQDIRAVLEQCNLTTVGENVAMGYRTGKAVVNKGWMKSPGHRANVLNGQFRLGVVQAAKGQDGAWYAVQLFGAR